MTPTKRLAAASAALALLVLAACGKSSTTGPSASTGAPVKGGTLRIVAASGPDHLDTVAAYYTADYAMERTYARQMLSYPYAVDPTITSAGWTKLVTPVPDIATEVPSTSNGGISSDGLTYTFHIRPGVMWNTNPARQVTAQDFIREFKAFYNPVAPVGAPFYYNAVISGLTQYDNAETAFFANAKKHPPTAANIANFQNTHTISGLSAPTPSTLQIKLMHPAADFLYMMAMPFSSARPVEYDAYVPDSAQFRDHTISDGPYQITAYTPGKSMTLSHNPAWKQSADPVRHQYVNSIQLTMGVQSAQTQLADEKANTYDLVLDTGFEPTAIPGMLASHDPKFKIWPASDTVPYVVFNLRSPDAKGAMGNLKVRQAIEYGVNKVAVQKALGGPDVVKILSTVIPPGNGGFVASNMYPDANGNGDTAKCKATLAAAGFKSVTLTDLYVNDSVNTRVFEAIQASLKSCGINLNGKAEPGSSFFTDLGNAPVNNQPGKWDLSSNAGWFPDWYGAANGRTIVPPFFQTNCVVNTINYGCYSSKKMDGLITSAEAATSTAAAAALWHQADVLAMQNALIVPMADQQYPYFSSARVHNAGSTAIVFTPNIGDPDFTNVWLSPNKP